MGEEGSLKILESNKNDKRCTKCDENVTDKKTRRNPIIKSNDASGRHSDVVFRSAESD